MQWKPSLQVDSHQSWTGQLPSAPYQRSEVETQTEAPASQQDAHEQRDLINVQQQLADAQLQAEKSSEQQQQTIASLEAQLAAQVTASQEAQHAAQHAEQALHDTQSEASSHETQLEVGSFKFTPIVVV